MTIPERLETLLKRTSTLAFALLAATAGCAATGSSPVQSPDSIRSGGSESLISAPAATTAFTDSMAFAAESSELARQVEIRRTTYGVPHILAENLRAAYFALAYVQIEDHGEGVIEGITAARGERGMIGLNEGESMVESDFRSRQRHARAVETFQRLGQDTRDVYQGFADGLNHYIRVNRDALPAWMRPDFTPYDVLARDIRWPSDGAMNQFRRQLEAARVASRLIVVEEDDQNVGSNALALAPSRTTSGNAILLRNPHLSWTAGYYEAHVRVPGKLDFYGDFRIGGPFTVIGGFNANLGFATTNNATRTHEFYALNVDPAKPDHVLLDGASLPLIREEVTVEFRNGPGIGTETRDFWTSPLGPVIHRADGLVYVYRPTLNGEYRAGEQWLAMMQAGNLAEWKDAMRIQARATSNFTYADRAGNILYVWVSAVPSLPHPPGGDTLAILATRTSDVWTELAPFDSLPQLLNPPGGYVRNENDSPHFTNLNAILDHDRYDFWVQEPRLRMRSQHGLELFHNDRVFSLEDVVETKHSMRMLLADRVKDDLVEAVRQQGAVGEVGAREEIARAVDFLEGWDNSVAAESRGGLLFETWWDRYRALVREANRGGGDREGDNDDNGGGDGGFHAVEWSLDELTTAPRGLRHPDLAAEAFAWAVSEARTRFGGWDAAWGEVHRVRRGDVDVPVGGCGGALGCFRVLNFSTEPDGKRVVDGGDGWVIAVEFGEVPRAYSVLGYGQSTNPASPWHANQAEMFAANRMKPVQWTEEDIEAAVVERYHPGEEAPRNGTGGR